MTNRATFSRVEFTAKKMSTRRARFLARREAVVPWDQFLAVNATHEPASERGRLPIGP
jgi:hypothetical protein